MNCFHCQAALRRGASTFTDSRKGYVLVVQDVPAWVCPQCGEPLFEEAAVEGMQTVLRTLDEKVEKILNQPDFEKRMALQREVAKWILDNSVHFPIAAINVVWPVGSKIDLWNFGCCARDIASNLEYVPHRGQVKGELFPK